MRHGVRCSTGFWLHSVDSAATGREELALELLKRKTCEALQMVACKIRLICNPIMAHAVAQPSMRWHCAALIKPGTAFARVQQGASSCAPMLHTQDVRSCPATPSAHLAVYEHPCLHQVKTCPACAWARRSPASSQSSLHREYLHQLPS